MKRNKKINKKINIKVSNSSYVNWPVAHDFDFVRFLGIIILFAGQNIK